MGMGVVKKPSKMSIDDLERERLRLRDTISKLDMRFKEVDQELSKRRTGAPHLMPWPTTPMEIESLNKDKERHKL
jgi:hypothetical protein